MPSEKVAKILRSKTSLTPQEITDLSEKDAWRRVYSLDEMKQSNRPKEVCFTGFNAAEKEQAMELASAAGLKTVTKVTKNLWCLCIGETPGESKLSAAKAQGVSVLNLDELEQRIKGNLHLGGQE